MYNRRLCRRMPSGKGSSTYRDFPRNVVCISHASFNDRSDLNRDSIAYIVIYGRDLNMSPREEVVVLR